jgi:hypothetical protein
MNTIVLNTLTGAVSEYTGFDFHAITPAYAGSANGLYAFGGDVDVSSLIVSEVMSGKTLIGESRKKLLDLVWFSIKGRGTSALMVQAEAATYTYTFPVRATGESRAEPGRGIRENYLAFGYTNTDGSAFSLDRMEVSGPATSKTRRV